MTEDIALIERLDKIITSMKAKYDAACADVNWFNNNVPSVGILVDCELPPNLKV